MRYLFLLLIVNNIVSVPLARTQYYDNTWILGYDYNTSKEGGYDDAAEGMILRFDKSPPSIEKHPIPFEMLDFSIMSNPETGDLMFYTNGCRIMNKNHDVMENGDSINQGVQWRYFCNEGPSSFYSDFNGSLSLPFPGQDNKGKYVLFTRPKNLEPVYIQKILYHIIDMNQNDGKGKVIKKNIELFKGDELAPASMQACKHANGTDWWIMQWERNKPLYHVFILDKNGPRFSHSASVGSNGPLSVSQACFSPDGTKFIWSDLNKGVGLYDFDRETGFLSNPKSKTISPLYQYGKGGVSFSRSGRFAYLSARYELFQLDTWEEDFDKAFTMIDTISIITPVGIPLNFSNSMLAPDCKIYISTGFTWFYYHVIHNPDEKGKACDLRKLDLQLPWPNRNSAVPNNVHYRMDEEEVCNPRLSSLFPEEWYGSKRVKLYPNPAMDRLTIEGIEGQGQVSFYNLTGQLMKKILTLNGQSLDISDLHQGVYILKVSGFETQSEPTFKLIKL
ncbi:MAG: T9SS type A sorting domain-containing protein [Saprospiraceae bacterium]|nr:T9SS type A sorting domain-containing protein [Saprospiraceae bacterium]